MIIKWIGQSGYILKTQKSEIIIDPYLSDSVNRLAGRPRMRPVPIEPKDVSCNAIICTHHHLDHLDLDAIQNIPNEQFFITTNEGKKLLEQSGKKNAIALNHGDSIKIGEFEIYAVYADHTVEAFGIVIKTEDYTLYFSGDTLHSEKLVEVAKFYPDVTFICINGKLGNMNVKEAIKIAKKIGAKVNIPNHYDMFESNSENPLLFTENIKGGKVLEFNKEYDILSLIM